MITVKNEISIKDFDAWDGGEDTLNDVRNVDKLDELDSLAEEMFPDGCTDTELNDWLWFKRDFIYKSLGLDENGEIPEDEDEQEDFPEELEAEIYITNTDMEAFRNNLDFQKTLVDDYFIDKFGDTPYSYNFKFMGRNSETGIAMFDVTDIDWSADD